MFVCENCGEKVNKEAVGTEYRNHCPYCLFSKHLDEKQPGDRQAGCGGLMEPVGLKFKRESDGPGEIMVVHQCQKCGQISSNRIAGDDHPESIIEVLEKGIKRRKPEGLLKEKNRREVLRQLFGEPWVEENFDKPK